MFIPIYLGLVIIKLIIALDMYFIFGLDFLELPLCVAAILYPHPIAPGLVARLTDFVTWADDITPHMKEVLVCGSACGVCMILLWSIGVHVMAPTLTSVIYM